MSQAVAGDGAGDDDRRALRRAALRLEARIDALLSPESQKIISSPGDMHAVDPRVAAPGGSVSLDELVQKSAPWDEAMLERGLTDGARVKAVFSKAFAQ